MKVDKVKITIEKDSKSLGSLGWAMDVQMALEKDDGTGKYVQDSATGVSFEALLESSPKIVRSLLNDALV